MFRGVCAINLDSKSRLSLPARYRDSIGSSSDGNLILTIDTEEKCLLLYPLPVWEQIEAKIAALPSFNKAARRIQRLLLGHATEVSVDSQGRILLPAPLKEFAGIDKKLMMIGQGKKFELWAEEHWLAKRDEWLENDQLDEGNVPTDLESLSL